MSEGLLNSIFGFFMLFFFIYSTMFYGIPSSSSKYTFVVSLGVLFFFKKKSDRFLPFRRAYLVAMLGFIFLSCYNLLVTGARGNYDYTLTIGFATHASFNLLGAYLIVNVLSRFCGMTRNNAHLWLAVVFLVQSISIFVGFISPTFRSITAQIITETGNLSALDSIRIRGLANCSGAGLSVSMALGGMLWLVAASTVKSGSGRLFCSLASISCAGATIFTGRTGMLMLILFAPTYLVVGILLKSVNIQGLKTYAIVFAGLIFIPFVSINYFISIELQQVLSETVFRRAFSLYYAFIDQGTFMTRTTDLIVDHMLFLPDSISTLVLGDGLFVLPEGGNYMATDSGYVRYIFAIGIFGSALYYSIMVFMFRHSYRNFGIPEFKTAIFVLFILLAVAEIKEPFFEKGAIGRAIMFLFVASFLPRSTPVTLDS